MAAIMSLFRSRVALVAALAVTLAACNDSPTAGDPAPTLGGLTVTTSSDRDTLVTGDTALITFRFTNPTDTTITLQSENFDNTDGKPCPVLLPVAAYPTTTTVYSFILSTCFGGSDTTLTGRFGLQKIVVPANSTVERIVPFTGYTRANATATPRCLATGKQWLLPLFLVRSRFLFPDGIDDVDGPELLYLKPPTADPAPCTVTSGT